MWHEVCSGVRWGLRYMMGLFFVIHVHVDKPAMCFGHVVIWVVIPYASLDVSSWCGWAICGFRSVDCCVLLFIPSISYVLISCSGGMLTSVNMLLMRAIDLSCVSILNRPFFTGIVMMVVCTSTMSLTLNIIGSTGWNLNIMIHV